MSECRFNSPCTMESCISFTAKLETSYTHSYIIRIGLSFGIARSLHDIFCKWFVEEEESKKDSSWEYSMSGIGGCGNQRPYLRRIYHITTNLSTSNSSPYTASSGSE